MDAIYFISPTHESISYFEKDFNGQMYRVAHLFFAGPLPSDLMGKIQNSKAIIHIKTLTELFVDYIALEQRIFSLNYPNAFVRLFSPNIGLHLRPELAKISKKLAVFAASLGDGVPYIRYYKSSNTENNRSQEVAAQLSLEIDSLVKSESWSAPPDAPKGTIIILDRTMDIIAPILHEFTYQAMVHDLLEIKDNKYSYNAGNDGPKEAILDDNDNLWKEFRHTHIAETSRSLNEQFNKFLSENKAASAAMGGKKDGNIKQMKETLASMPQFQEMKQKYTIHVNIAQECMATFERRKIGSTGLLEQTMATGENSDGTKPKNIVPDLVLFLDDANVTQNDKVRLLMLYIIFKEGILDEDRRKLFTHAKLDVKEDTSITNLALLGVKLTRSQKEKRKKEDKKTKKNESDAAFELSRYKTQLKTILEELVNNSLSQENFPFHGIRPSNDNSPAAVATKMAGTSLRSTKPSWQKKTNETQEKLPKNIIFIIGGMTYSEMRTIYEISAATKKEFVLGSTHIMNPSSFIEDLKILRDSNPKELNDTGYGSGVVSEPPGRKKSKKVSQASLDKLNDKKEKKKFLGIF